MSNNTDKTDKVIYSKIIKFLEQEKILSVSIDPGFDSFKIIVNGEEFNSPSKCIKYEDSFVYDNSNGVFKGVVTKFSTESDRSLEYLVGDAAQKMLKNNKTIRERYNEDNARINMNLEERFTNADFLAMLKAQTSHAIINYAQLKNIDIKELANWKVYLGIALPHDSFLDYKIKKSTAISITTSINKYLKLENYHILIDDASYELTLNNIESITYWSQTYCILYIYVDYCDKNNKELEFPAVIFDGGYKTDGLVSVTDDWQTHLGESNTDYAMYNVNKELERKLQERGCKTVFEYNIESIIDTTDFAVIKDESGKTEKVKLSTEKELVLKDMSNKAMQYIANKFSDMEEALTFILGGGTGQAYSPYFTEICNEKYGHLTIYDVKPFIDDRSYEPIYGVACGMHLKMLYSLATKHNMN